MSPRIAIDPLGRYIAVTIAYDPDIIFLNAHSLKEEFRITLPVLPQDLNYFEHVEYLKFSHEGRYMALSISSYGKKIFILDVEQRIILNSTPKYNEMVQEFKFIKHKSEICLLLVLNNGVLHSKFTNIIVWSFIQDKELFTSKYVNYIDVYDCFEDMILFKNSNGIQISYSLDLSNSTVLNQYQDTTENILGQFFSADKKYLIIYSEKYIQIWTLTTMSDMYEIKFYESIHKVLYASDKLYILCTNNIFQIYDLITRKLITQNNELFNYVERRIYDFYISPKGKYLFVRVEINKYEVSAPYFDDALRMFFSWCNSIQDDIQIIQWSDNDYAQVSKEIQLKNISLSVQNKKYIDTAWLDFQFEYGHTLGLEHNASLKDAVMYAGKDFCGHQHDALVDARNTASLFGIVRDEAKR